jgi:DNA (cytosine-5)-methyltransferase 1
MGMRVAAAIVPEHDRQANIRIAKAPERRLRILEFFAGSGLVAHGLNGLFDIAWANDICLKKAAVYTANHKGANFRLGDIAQVNGGVLPHAHLSWASFPCQDLSLAGMVNGIKAKRSGLVWEWLRVMDEMEERPRVLVAENVVGLISTDGGKNYRLLHQALFERGYKIGAMLINASHFVPQSRPRVFVVAVAADVNIPDELMDKSSNWLHSDSLKKMASDLPGWIWWHMPPPPPRKKSLMDIVEWDAPSDPESVVQRNLEIMAQKHRERLLAAPDNATLIATGYRRTRNGSQVLEVRFDGIAGCLRTPEGGSSRQLLIIKRNGNISTRLLTVREAARLMGAPEAFQLPGSYNDGYKAMGDAVAAPVVEYLGRNLLRKLTEAAYE